MHESYIIPGLIDGAVVKEQAYKRANAKPFGSIGPEPTYIHFHEHGVPCRDYVGDVPCYEVPIGAKVPEVKR